MWKDEFKEILFSNDPNKIDPVNAIKLKYNNFPAFLYQYKSFDEKGYSLELLKTDKMHLQTPEHFNDPYDSGFVLLSKDMGNEKIKDILLENLNVLRQELNLSNKEEFKLKKKIIKSNNVILDVAKVYAKKIDPNHEKTPEERAQIAKKFTDNLENSDTKTYQRFKRKYYISCFSEDNNSILMWSHYANYHKGFCVEYNFKELGIKNYLTRCIFPVFYTNTVFDLGKYYPRSDKGFEDVLSNFMNGININEIRDGLTFPERNTKTNNMALFYASLHKYNGWDYEKEWRYVFPYKRSDKQIYINVPKPTAIYLGSEISKESPENKEAILEIGRKRNINVYQMQMESSEFRLNSTKIQ